MQWADEWWKANMADVRHPGCPNNDPFTQVWHHSTKEQKLWDLASTHKDRVRADTGWAPTTRLRGIPPDLCSLTDIILRNLVKSHESVRLTNRILQ